MEHPRLVAPSAFCWNPDCPAYGQVQQGNIRRFGRTSRGTQRFQCRTCQHTFVETIGTVFYGRRHDQATILECLALLAERTSLAALHRTKGIKEDTVLDWLREAANHVEQIEALLLANYRLTRAQLDALWTYVGHKGAKGGVLRRMSVAPSGVGQPSTSTRACASGGPSPRPRRRSRRT
jgi:transposase-like protein